MKFSFFICVSLYINTKKNNCLKITCCKLLISTIYFFKYGRASLISCGAVSSFKDMVSFPAIHLKGTHIRCVPQVYNRKIGLMSQGLSDTNSSNRSISDTNFSNRICLMIFFFKFRATELLVFPLIIYSIYATTSSSEFFKF